MAATLTATVIFGFVLAMKVDLLGVLIRPLHPYLDGEKLKYLSPMDPFLVTLRLAVLVGIVLTLPVLLYHLWGVLRPMLRPAERRLALPTLVSAAVLFLAGAVFAFLGVLPLTLRFAMSFQTESLQQEILVTSYLSLATHILVAFGIAFELPVILLIGTLLHVVTPEMLASKRRHALALAVIVGGVLTPPDVASQLMMAVPLYVLFEIGVLVSRVAVARGYGGRRLLPES